MATMGRTTQSRMEGSRRSGVCGAVAAISLCVGGVRRRRRAARPFSGAAPRGAAGLFLECGFSGGAAQRGGRLNDQTALQAYACDNFLIREQRRISRGGACLAFLECLETLVRAWDRSMLRDGKEEDGDGAGKEGEGGRGRPHGVANCR